MNADACGVGRSLVERLRHLRPTGREHVTELGILLVPGPFQLEERVAVADAARIPGVGLATPQVFCTDTALHRWRTVSV